VSFGPACDGTGDAVVCQVAVPEKDEDYGVWFRAARSKSAGLMGAPMTTRTESPSRLGATDNPATSSSASAYALSVIRGTAVKLVSRDNTD